MSKTFRLKSFIALFTLCLVVLMGAGFTGCKSQKKALEAQEQAAREAEMAAVEAAKAKLRDLIADQSLTIEEKRRGLNQVKAQNLEDEEVQALITELENHIAELEEAERKRKEEEAKASVTPEQQLQEYFTAISSAPNLNAANGNIDQALDMFASEDVPVLIIIGKFEGENDYDEPTTIRKYLEYLKDQKKNPNAVENLVFDSNGKISEVELIKK